MKETISNKIKPATLRESWIEYVHRLQEEICSALEGVDGKATFREDQWERSGQGGGGKTRILENGAVFEKGGVNSSVVFGKVTDAMKLPLAIDGSTWFACGLSLVLHPTNPFVPTVHANWRYFELYDPLGMLSDRWFGGGTDLTPYYLFPEDVHHFHSVLKNILDPFGKELYPGYKKNCDQYFANHHRQDEMRGVGGIFYDDIRPKDESDAQRWFAFQQSNGNSFLEAYLPLVEKRKNLPYGQREINWQEIRRGRYVEFNLIHDRGTLFGLKTQGRTESILMSLPPRAKWVYDFRPEPGSREDELWQVCLHPKEWI